MSTNGLPESFALAMLEAVADGLLAVDEHGAIVFANAAAVALFGWPREELVGQAIERLVPESLREAHQSHRLRYAEAPRMRPMGKGQVLLGRRRDGTELPIEVQLSPMQGPQGALVLASVRDVTERQAGLEALARSEAQLRELIAQAPDGIVVSDAEGRYVEVNPAMCRMLGRSREELIGKAAVDVLDPEDLPRITPSRERVLGAEDTVELGEWTFLRKDGTRVPTEVSAKALADGRRQGFVRDISERKRAEQELRVAEAERAAALRELEAALEQCPAGIAIVRGPGAQRVTVNRATREIWGHRIDPARGTEQPTGILCRSDGVPLPRADFPAIRAFRGERIEHERYAVRSADGEALVPYEVNAGPIFGDDGGIVGAVVVAWNVSAVVQLERLRAEWNSVIAHDLRQPLHSIKLFAQMLRRHVNKSPELVLRDVDGITQLIDRLTRMTSDPLDLSRLDASRLTIEWIPLDVVECVRSAVERIELEDPGLRVHVRVDGGIARIEGDPQRIAQVMDNLLSNAVKYRAADSVIRVAIEREAARVAVSVTNEGPGIEAEDLARLFRRFERVSSATQSGAPGIGLGLQIARGLVEAHGGELTVESVPGGETTFRFALPIVRPAGMRGGGERSGRRTIG